MPRISVKPWPHTDVTTFGASIPNDWSPVLLWRQCPVWVLMPYPVAYVSVVPYNPLQMSKPFLAGRL